MQSSMCWRSRVAAVKTIYSSSRQSHRRACYLQSVEALETAQMHLVERRHTAPGNDVVCASYQGTAWANIANGKLCLSGAVS